MHQLDTESIFEFPETFNWKSLYIILYKNVVSLSLSFIECLVKLQLWLEIISNFIHFFFLSRSVHTDKLDR